MVPQKSIDAALAWLTGAARVADNQPVGERGKAMPLQSWQGAIRGEYLSTRKNWESFCPVWHTGQAVKALVMLKEYEEAKICADFVIANQVTDGEDAGLLLAVEDHPELVNTSALMEALDGLFMLSEATGEKQYARCAVDALDWTMRKMWDPLVGKFRGTYHVKEKCIITDHPASVERPLLDDAVYITAWKLTGNEDFKHVATGAADTLLREEGPDGNWVCYIPCVTSEGLIHPRQAYWWAKPMLDVYKATGDERYLECYKRGAMWYKSALRLDGGLFRHTGVDFNSWSSGHSASGSACAALYLAEYRDFTGDDTVTEYIDRALQFCVSMQFDCPQNPDIHGAVLEKILPPDGSPEIPWQLRDLGTIFFLQAAGYLKNKKL